MIGLTRRAFLIAAALLAPAATAVAGQAGQQSARAISLEEFMALSQRLVGRPRLDARIGKIYLDALLAASGNRPILERLARSTADAGAAQSALERTIIECWYTGTYTRRGERRLATHDGALMWNASGAPAPGPCAMAFGAWARPPQRAL